MMKTDCSNGNHVQGYSMGEKIIAQGFFNSMILLGVAGLWNASPTGALLYLGYAVGSFTLLIRPLKNSNLLRCCKKFKLLRMSNTRRP